MKFREAHIDDIPQIQLIRRSVKENILADPKKVTDAHCKEYLTARGKGWVCEINSMLVGFAIVDLKENNIWALFVHPEHEGKGIGRQLHDLMLSWYFSYNKEEVWLGTSLNTRAEQFYRKMGWVEAGMKGEDELCFKMSRQRWMNRRVSKI